MVARDGSCDYGEGCCEVCGGNVRHLSEREWQEVQAMRRHDPPPEGCRRGEHDMQGNAYRSECRACGFLRLVVADTPDDGRCCTFPGASPGKMPMHCWACGCGCHVWEEL